MATIHLKVDTSVMKAKAAQVSGEVQKIEKEWKSLQNTVKKSKSYWQGDASNEHQKYLEEVADDVEKIIRRMKEHPKDLLKMAGIYEGAESGAEALSGKLPDNVIL